MEVSGTSVADAPPTIAVTAPGAGATVRGNITVTADANDDVGVAGIEFQIDGTDVGTEDTTAPYSVAWDTTTAAAGAHALTAVARDSSGKRTTSGAVSVTVDNSVPAGPQPVAAYSFEDGIGLDADRPDREGAHGNDPRGGCRSAAGRNGKALHFDGVNDWVTIDDAADLRLTAGADARGVGVPDERQRLAHGAAEGALGLIPRTRCTRPDPPRSSLYVTSGFVRSGTALAVNTWSHLAATYDGTTLRVYVRVQRGTATLANGLTASAGVLRLGGNGAWASTSRAGSMTCACTPLR